MFRGRVVGELDGDWADDRLVAAMEGIELE
jgi:hypothetical protein